MQNSIQNNPDNKMSQAKAAAAAQAFQPPPHLVNPNTPDKVIFPNPHITPQINPDDPRLVMIAESMR